MSIKYKSPRAGQNAPQAQMLALLDRPGINHTAPEYADLLKDLQANILNHNKRDHLEYLFLYFIDNEVAAKNVKNWISNDLADQISSASFQLNAKDKRPDLLTFSLTSDGFKYLGFNDFQLPDDEAFRGEIVKRLHFNGSDANEPYLENPPHAVLFLATNDATVPSVGNRDVNLGQTKFAYAFPALYQTLLPLLSNKGVLRVESGMGLPRNQTNPLPADLQFEDGISNSVFFPGAFESKLKKDKSYSDADMPPLKTLLIGDKYGNNFWSCGSFGAFLKFEFDVPAMERQMAQLGANLLDKYYPKFYKNHVKPPRARNDFKKWKPQMALALVIGRFPDGTPLTFSYMSKGLKVNNFNYTEYIKKLDQFEVQNDELGARCPLHTHARKANPRLVDYQYLKIARRGAMYGRNPSDCGLLFFSYQSSLVDQFEQIVNNFMLNPNSRMNRNGQQGYRMVKSGKDILFSEPGDEYLMPTTWNGDPAKDVVSLKITDRMIKYRGGVYMFTPSISFLKRVNLFP